MSVLYSGLLSSQGKLSDNKNMRAGYNHNRNSHSSLFINESDAT